MFVVFNPLWSLGIHPVNLSIDKHPCFPACSLLMSCIHLVTVSSSQFQGAAYTWNMFVLLAYVALANESMNVVISGMRDLILSAHACMALITIL